jgi:hypothetical protein
MSMSGCYGPQDDAECVRTIRRALERGVNLLDTSHSYGEGHNQMLIARAIRGMRNSFVIHSKTGSPRSKPGDLVNRGGGDEAYLRKTCEESLTRLGIDQLDVFCLSRVDRNVPIEDTVGACLLGNERSLRSLRRTAVTCKTPANSCASLSACKRLIWPTWRGSARRYGADPASAPQDVGCEPD